MANLVKEKVDASKERMIATLSIMNTEYLRGVKNLVTRDLIRTEWCWTVFKWCSDYFEAYGRAPERDIQELYQAHRSSMDDSEAPLVAKFLHDLSERYEPVSNIPYQVEQTENYLTVRNGELVLEELKLAIAEGNAQSVEAAMARFKAIRGERTTAIDALNDDDEIIAAFAHEDRLLFRFDGALGLVAGDFNRTDLVGFQGFSKTGKSWYLLHSALTAVQWGLNVLYISLEMPKDQVLRRMWTGLTGKPKIEKKVRIPYFYEADGQEGKFGVDYHEEDRPGFYPTKEKLESWRYNWRKYYRKGSLRVESMPSNSIMIKDLLAYFDSLEYYEDYTPDVIVIDYADLVSSREKELRFKLDDIWKNLRRYAMDKDICIVTASQSGRSAARGDSEADNISESILKIAHVTKMLAVNSSKEEKAAGIVRIANIAEREGSGVYDQAVVLQALDIGQPVVDSRLRSEVITIRGGNDD